VERNGEKHQSMPPTPLFNWSRLQQKRQGRQGHFVDQLAAKRVTERVADIARPFASAAIWADDKDACYQALAETGKIQEHCERLPVRAAEEYPAVVWQADTLVPLSPERYDLLLTHSQLQWVNNLPECLLRLRFLLREGGLLIGALIGQDSFQELRHVLLETETRLRGGAHPRVMPTLDSRTLAGLLVQQGFHAPVVDVDTLTLTYPNLFALIQDFRALGWTNPLHQQARSLPPRFFFEEAAHHYQRLYPGHNGGIRLTVEIVFLAGWRYTVPPPSGEKGIFGDG
jgi:NADH dehydrogenase [ubiquinone] 1 alpha subcomplex assembly factor 5